MLVPVFGASMLSDTFPRIHNFIGGEFVAGHRTFAKINPATGARAGDVYEADKALVGRAVSAARDALEGAWSRLAPAARGKLLHRIADGIEARFDDFVNAEVTDTGKPVKQARTLDIPRGVANFRLFADLAEQHGDTCFHTHCADGSSALNYPVRKPVGVCAVISPWNLPLLLTTWKLAPALACGNTVVVKPSEETPSTATLLAEVMRDAGVPGGVYNLVHGSGADSTGEFLASHPGIDAITFTGESRTGAAIMKMAADGVKDISLELGGKNAGIVFADADFDKAVKGTARSTFSNCGQICLCTERVYVERPIYDDFVKALAHEANAINIGDPLAEDTDMGPLVSHRHREKVLAYFALARTEGGCFAAGGDIPVVDGSLAEGAFIQPSVVTGLEQTSRCMREEIFGPVCGVIAFDTEQEAIVLANDSEYGLAAVVWTENLNRAHRVAPQINAGIIWVNTWLQRDLRTPFGGVGKSGIGREGGRYSMDFYSQVSNICINGG